MPTWFISGGCSSQNSTSTRSPSLPLKSSGLRIKNTSPPPDAIRSNSRCYNQTNKIQSVTKSKNRKKMAEWQSYFGLLSDVLEQRLHGMMRSTGQTTMWKSLWRWSMERAQFDRSHVRWNERWTQFNHRRWMLNEISTTNFQSHRTFSRFGRIMTIGREENES